MKDNSGINILDYISVGHDNAITSSEIARCLDINEREVREMIHSERYNTIILNMQDEYGYFFPDEEEDDLIFKWINQEEDRLKSIASSCTQRGRGEKRERMPGRRSWNLAKALKLTRRREDNHDGREELNAFYALFL